MIRSLYVRTVGTFIIAVLVSAILSFFISQLLIQRSDDRFKPRPQDDMLTAAYYVIQLMKDSSVTNPDSYITRFALLQNQLITIYNDKGIVKRYGNEDNAADSAGISDMEVAGVLAGEPYNRERVTPDTPELLLIGLPFEHGGERRAIFIQPNFRQHVQEIRGLTSLVLLIALGFGSLLILIASRYLVRPLLDLTEAMRRLAKGDFDVKVSIRTKDELGFLADSFNHMAGELRQLERMRQDFVANVSHEIQTPLTSIRGFSKAIREKLISETDRDRCLDIIQSECERLSRLVENLLRLASLESDQHPFELVRYDLDEQLRRVLLVNTPMLEQKNISLDLSLRKTPVTADKDQLYQVWINLLQNSIKFTPEGGSIAVTVSQENGFASVVIDDSGIGIAPEDKERIFDRFYKADKSRDASEEGSGLGLAIVKKIADNHRALIELDSEPGRGTRITVKIPVV